MILKEKTIKSKYVYESERMKLRLDNVSIEGKGEFIREVVEMSPAVAMIPVDKDGKIIFVRQYRYAIDAVVVELPAGKIDRGETPQEAAARELREETKYAAANIREIITTQRSPGYKVESLYFFLAEKLTYSPLPQDKDESIETVALTVEEAINEFGKSIVDQKTMLGVLYYKEIMSK